MNKNKIIKLSIASLFILFSSMFLYKIIYINIVPNKYLILIILALLVLNAIAIFFLFKKNKWFKIISILIYIILLISCTAGIIYIDKTNNFLNKTFKNNEITTLNIKYLLLSKNKYEKEDLYYKDIYYDNIDTEVDKALLQLNKIYTYNVKNIANDIYKQDVFFISENYYEDLQEIHGINPHDYNVLDTIEFEIKIQNEQVISEKKDTYNIYLAGKDFSGIRVDLNKIITVNTKTHEVLITNINRFSYLDFGERGKNRLSSTGYYGVNYNKNAIAEKLNIDIDYYFSIETKGLVNVVDVLGGIEYCSDTSYYTTHALVLDTYDDSKGKKLFVKKGCQHLNGIETLTVARERNAFDGWITQRERNTNAIMLDILDSAKQPSNILNYPKILDSMDGMYKTNIPKNIIQKLTKSILNDEWSIKTEEINGEYGFNRISFGRDSGYVYYLDEKSVNETTKNINDLYNKNK